MLISLLMLVVSAAPPAVFDCKTRKCTATKEAGDVWKVTLPKKEDEDCREPPEEYWLVPKRGPAQLLIELCNNGYGASGVGEDTINFDASTFSHSRYGGSAWRWSTETELALSPLRVVSEKAQSFHATMSEFSKESEWNWDDFRGRTKHAVAECDGEGTALEDSRATEIEANLIPSVELPDAFLDGGWKTTGLGDCSAAASFVTFGTQTTKNDASMKVLGSPGLLFVEIRDDVFVEKATKWTHADHVEVWTGIPSDSWNECTGFRGGTQWGFALDGAINAGFGAPKVGTAKVDVVRSKGVVRMMISVAHQGGSRLGVVDSDSDDGRKQKALIATSPLQFGDVSTFSEVKYVNETQAVCHVKHGVLVPKNTRVFTTTTPVIP